MNVYETGYESGLAMAPGRSCDCSYRLSQPSETKSLTVMMIFYFSLGGCKISSAPPVGFACECKYQVVSSAILC